MKFLNIFYVYFQRCTDKQVELSVSMAFGSQVKYRKSLVNGVVVAAGVEVAAAAAVVVATVAVVQVSPLTLYRPSVTVAGIIIDMKKRVES